MRKVPFIFTSVSASSEEFKEKPVPQLSLQRMSAFIECKKELDNKLRSIPGGNFELIAKLYDAFDEAIMDELETANRFKSKFDLNDESDG